MPMPDVEVLERNVAVLQKLDDNQLIMLALAELMSALPMNGIVGVPPGKAVAFHAELSRRSGVKFDG